MEALSDLDIMAQRTGRTPAEVDRAWRLDKLRHDIQLVNAGQAHYIQPNRPPLFRGGACV